MLSINRYQQIIQQQIQQIMEKTNVDSLRDLEREKEELHLHQINNHHPLHDHVRVHVHVTQEINHADIIEKKNQVINVKIKHQNRAQNVVQNNQSRRTNQNRKINQAQR